MERHVTTKPCESLTVGFHCPRCDANVMLSGTAPPGTTSIEHDCAPVVKLGETIECDPETLKNAKVEL